MAFLVVNHEMPLVNKVLRGESRMDTYIYYFFLLLCNFNQLEKSPSKVRYLEKIEDLRPISD